MAAIPVVDLSSGDGANLIDTEIEDFVGKSYQKLKKWRDSVKMSDGNFTCPYCPMKKRKRSYPYEGLLKHAIAIGESNTETKSLKLKANHLALATFLEMEVGGVSSDPTSSYETEELFVFPWTGVVVNIETRWVDGRYIGESGSRLRNELASRGFNPKRVQPLWDHRGHSGSAIVEFTNDWSGFNNAMSFEKSYEADGHGKTHWKTSKDRRSGIYAWVARADDYYNSEGIIGESLKKIGYLKIVSGIMREEAHNTGKPVSNLKSLIEEKKRELEEMENKFDESSRILAKAMAENHKLRLSYSEEMKKIQSSAKEHFQKVLDDHEKFKARLESQKKELDLRGEELKKREVKNEDEMKKLYEEMEKNEANNRSLLKAEAEQKKDHEKVLKLAEEQQREKEELHYKIVQLEKKLDAKQALELEIEVLRGKVNVAMKMKDDGERKGVDDLRKELSEKEEELEDLKALNQALIIKERKSNDEIQEARKELITGFSIKQVNGHVRVKRMGELDIKIFIKAAKLKYADGADAEYKATELCSLWEGHLRDPAWHPFQTIEINGKLQEIIKEDDEKLKGLKDEWGDEVYKAVTTALKEMNEFSPSERCVVSELWNYASGKKVSLQEGVQVLLKLFKASRLRKKRQRSRYC